MESAVLESIVEHKDIGLKLVTGALTSLFSP